MTNDPKPGNAQKFARVRDKTNPAIPLMAIVIAALFFLATLAGVLYTRFRASAASDPLATARAADAGKTVTVSGPGSPSMYGPAVQATPFVLPSDPTDSPAPSPSPALKRVVVQGNPGNPGCDPRYPFANGGACLPTPTPQPSATPFVPVPHPGATVPPISPGANPNVNPPPPVVTPTPSPSPNVTIAPLFASQMQNGGGDQERTGAEPTATPAVPATAALSPSGSTAGYIPLGSKNQVGVGTVIVGRLTTKVDSTLPGFVCIQTHGAVMDSQTHRHVVIPEFTFACGAYGNVLADGQNKLFLAFTTLRFPNGREFNLGTLPVVDAQGASGVGGDTDTHRAALYTSAALITLIGAAEAAIAPQTGSSVLTTPSIGDQTRTAAGNQIGSIGNAVISKALGRPPTIILRPPTLVNIMVTRDLPLDDYEVIRKQ